MTRALSSPRSGSGFRDLAAALSVPVSAQSLAVLRMSVGLLLMIDCWRFIDHGRVARYWAEPEILFHYPGFSWVTPLPQPWLMAAWLGMGVLALFVTLGLFYRVSIVALTLVFAYFFLLERAEYLNHFYLVLLFLALLCVLPAHRAWSVDAWRRPAVAGPVPLGAVWLVKAQVEIVLIFAGLVKLTPDWLAGEPLGLWLRDQADTHLLGFLFGYDWVILSATWGTIALHVLGAPLLLWRRTRLVTFLVYSLFHLANASLFNIGIFPWLTIAASTIFFAPDWPGRLAARVAGVTPALPVPPSAALPRLSQAALAGMALWLAVQIALPLRAGFFGSEVRWSGEGHMFSWRMRIYDRDAAGVFQVSEPGGQTWTVDPESLLAPRQAGKMLVRADMIHQFAQDLEEIWRAAGYPDVAVRATICKSLNGRPAQLYIDPAVDLTAVPYRLFATADWVLPLQIPVWGVADNRRDPPAPVTLDCAA